MCIYYYFNTASKQPKSAQNKPRKTPRLFSEKNLEKPRGFENKPRKTPRLFFLRFFWRSQVVEIKHEKTQAKPRPNLEKSNSHTHSHTHSKKRRDQALNNCLLKLSKLIKPRLYKTLIRGGV